MAENSKIEWTDATWNCIIGCSKVSSGCANCYPIKDVHRMSFNPNSKIREANIGLVERLPNGKLNWTGQVRCLPERLMIPMQWKSPRKIFVNSMSDLFHEQVPFDFIDQVFAVMALCPQHIFQILTKRPERMAAYLGNDLRADYITEEVCRIEPDAWVKYRRQIFDPTFDDCGKLDRYEVWYPLPNVWLGTSVENQQTADERIPHLLQVPAAVRFLSCEPLLGPVNLDEVERVPGIGPDDISEEYNALGPPLYCDGIHWVIAGGESGANARPMHPDWARSLRDQCQAAGIPFFFKQWGEYVPAPLFTPGDNESVDEDSEEFDRVFGKRGAGGLFVYPNGDAVAPHFINPLPGLIYPSNKSASLMMRVGKKAAGRVLDGRTWNELPEVRA